MGYASEIDRDHEWTTINDVITNVDYDNSLYIDEDKCVYRIAYFYHTNVKDKERVLVGMQSYANVIFRLGSNKTKRIRKFEGKLILTNDD